MRKETLVEHCIKEVKKKGIRIIGGGAIFDWCDDQFPPKKSELPSGCDGFGAVLIEKGLVHKFYPGFPEGWLKELCSIVECDSYWWWRFNMGFGYHTHLNLISQKDGKEIIIKDSVSKIGITLYKKYRSPTRYGR